MKDITSDLAVIYVFEVTMMTRQKELSRNSEPRSRRPSFYKFRSRYDVQARNTNLRILLSCQIRVSAKTSQRPQSASISGAKHDSRTRVPVSTISARPGKLQILDGLKSGILIGEARTMALMADTWILQLVSMLAWPQGNTLTTAGRVID